MFRREPLSNSLVHLLDGFLLHFDLRRIYLNLNRFIFLPLDFLSGFPLGDPSESLPSESFYILKRETLHFRIRLFSEIRSSSPIWNKKRKSPSLQVQIFLEEERTIKPFSLIEIHLSLDRRNIIQWKKSSVSFGKTLI